ncbi:MAG: hypoxanthine phosphoribosyltransferase [Thermomicrobiales bacterium]|nr:hypoxanthine phosphoribosyltransferase [Thermomicrobiales bacterium]
MVHRRADEGEGPARGGPGDGVDTACRIVQPSFPSLRRILRADDGQFAHPAERDFARLLRYYRIRWAYEPTSFALDWADDGRANAFFTPDFYLPDHDLYVELTTMRQPLVTRKHRKLRRLRELYPNVRVKLLYRRDVLRLQASYPALRRPAGIERLGPALIAAGDVERRVHALGERIADEWLGSRLGQKPPVLLAVGPGSVRLQALLARELSQLGMSAEMDRIDLTRCRAADGITSVRTARGAARPLRHRPVLVVSDVVSTGLSLGFLSGWLARHGADDWRACALLDRTGARVIDVPVAYAAFEAPDDLLVGYGLTLRRQYRDLPYVARLVRET